MVKEWKESLALFAKADAALYAAKRTGRNRAILWNSELREE